MRAGGSAIGSISTSSRYTTPPSAMPPPGRLCPSPRRCGGRRVSTCRRAGSTASRSGDVLGEHTVKFAGVGERLTIFPPGDEPGGLRPGGAASRGLELFRALRSGLRPNPRSGGYFIALRRALRAHTRSGTRRRIHPPPLSGRSGGPEWAHPLHPLKEPAPAARPTGRSHRKRGVARGRSAPSASTGERAVG